MKEQSKSEIAEHKYRPLKKRLRGFYNKIKAALNRGTLPNSAILSDFMALTQIMVSYPGFGDDYYDYFRKSCLAFEKACRENDLSKAQEAFSTIMQLKHDCHHRDDASGLP